MITSLCIITAGITGAMGTFYVNERLKQGPVRASACLSLLVGLFFRFFPGLMPPDLTEGIPVAFIGASFVGMVSSKVLANYWLIAVAGLIYSVIYLNTSRFFNGFGGALGTSACIALLVTLSLPVLLSKQRTVNGILILRRWLFGRKKE